MKRSAIYAAILVAGLIPAALLMLYFYYKNMNGANGNGIEASEH